METRPLSDLISALRKGDGNGCRHANALMQEAADALMANQGAIVNSIIERTRHEATDDEREAITDDGLWDFASDLLDAWNIEDLNPPSLAEDFRDRFVRRFRRSEVPEPSAPSEHGGTIPLYGMLDVWMALNGTSHPEFDAFYAEHGYAETWARILAAVRQRRSEPQGEPSDAQVKAAMTEASRRSLMWRTSSDVRAVLMAAFAVTEQGESRDA